MSARSKAKARRRRQKRRLKKQAEESKHEAGDIIAKGEAVTVESFLVSGEDAQVVKVDEELGLVIGWAVICKVDGEDHFDTQGDNVSEDALVEAAADFMEHSRVAKEMHKGGSRGTVVFAFPLTTDIAKSLGIETRVTGFLVGMKPDPEMLEKFRSGELRGFSIGGIRLEDEEVPE